MHCQYQSAFFTITLVNSCWHKKNHAKHQHKIAQQIVLLLSHCKWPDHCAQDA